MKIFKLILAFTILTSCTSAQVTQIVPNGANMNNYPQNGVYYKDINNEMAQYEGIWSSVQNNKKYIFHFVKFVQQYHEKTGNTGYFYTDDLKIKFKVIDLLSNTILYDDTNITNYNAFKIIGLNLKTGAYWYKDRQNCDLDINFNILNVAGNPNQIKYCYFEYYGYKSEGCSYPNISSIPMFLPKEDLIFTKQ